MYDKRPDETSGKYLGKKLDVMFECVRASVYANATSFTVRDFAVSPAVHGRLDNVLDHKHETATDNAGNGDDGVQTAIGQQCACHAECLPINSATTERFTRLPLNSNESTTFATK